MRDHGVVVVFKFCFYVHRRISTTRNVTINLIHSFDLFIYFVLRAPLQKKRQRDGDEGCGRDF